MSLVLVLSVMQPQSPEEVSHARSRCIIWKGGCV